MHAIGSGESQLPCRDDQECDWAATLFVLQLVAQCEQVRRCGSDGFGASEFHLERNPASSA